MDKLIIQLLMKVFLILFPLISIHLLIILLRRSLHLARRVRGSIVGELFSLRCTLCDGKGKLRDPWGRNDWEDVWGRKGDPKLSTCPQCQGGRSLLPVPLLWSEILPLIAILLATDLLTYPPSVPSTTLEGIWLLIVVAYIVLWVLGLCIDGIFRKG